MAITALNGSPIIPIGGVPLSRLSAQTFPSAANVTQDATNEACIMWGHVVTDDGGSHTIDTSGSSALGWRPGSVTFADGGSTFVVGLATLEAGTGPAARATNSSDVITPSVSKTLTGGGGGVSANAWNSHVPDTGSLSVAHGDLVAFFTQMTARGGSDSINTSVGSVGAAFQRPGVTSFTGGAYAATTNTPNCLITFSDGHLGWFAGSFVALTYTSTSNYSSSSSPNERGNIIELPFPAKVYGIALMANFLGDGELVIYSDPLGTPVAERTISVDANQRQVNGLRYGEYLFSSPYLVKARTPVAAILKPTTTSNVSMPFRAYDAATHRLTEPLGDLMYACNRASGAFADQNSSTEVYGIGLLVGAFEHGVHPSYGMGI